MNAPVKLDGLEVGYDIPALPGMDEADIQTPCLVLDLDALERNIKKMGDYRQGRWACATACMARCTSRWTWRCCRNGWAGRSASAARR